MRSLTVHHCGGKLILHVDKDGDKCLLCLKCGSVFYPNGIGVI